MSAALFDGFAAEKTSHAIFYALRAIKSSHFSNVYFLKKISMKREKIQVPAVRIVSAERLYRVLSDKYIMIIA